MLLTHGVGGAESDSRRAYSAKKQSLHYVSDKAGAGGVNAIFDDIAQSEHGYVYMLYICMYVCVCLCLCLYVYVCYLMRSSKYTVVEIYSKYLCVLRANNKHLHKVAKRTPKD
jgi:hypothetical protein